MHNSLRQLRYIFATIFLFSASVLSLTGCADNSRSATSSSSEAASEGEVTSAAEDASALTTAGATVEHKSGKVSLVAFRDVPIDDSLASKLPQFASLENLTILESNMTDEGWASIGKLATLRQLDLRGCAVNNEQLKLAVSGMPKLRALRLSGKNGQTSVDDAGLEVLSRCPELTALAIDYLWVTSEGVKHLAGNQQLAEFYAAGTALDDEAAEILSHLPKLKKLRLAASTVGTAGLEAFTKLQLSELDISECSQISDESMEPVGRMAALQRLNLWRDSVGDSGVKQLAGLKNMQWLNLDNTHLTDAGLPHLSEMTKLTFLHLGSTAITDQGMADFPELPELRDLKVTRTAVTEEGVAAVKKKIPGVEVQLLYVEGE